MTTADGPNDRGCRWCHALPGEFCEEDCGGPAPVLHPDFVPGPDDCLSCFGKVQADGSCACNEYDGPCAGFLVRPHACNPHYRDGGAA